MTKYKVLIAAIILAGFTITGFAQVNREELQDLPPVVFYNYEGPHTRVDTREEIRQIGVVLGQQVAARQRGIAAALDAMTQEERDNYSYRFETGANNRYFVIHSVSGPDGNKLDADILGLGVDVAVDHIRNLRVIIQGYLQAAYGYSASDALLLAEFITIYNAVYRGNWDYFVNRYKTPVMENLTRDRVGLSIRYDEWPGRTLIVIPLGHGGLSSIDTSVISDINVIDELRREEDLGIPQRQQLIDLMEREAEEAEQQAEIIREAIREEERQITEERTQIVQERQQIEQERQVVQEEQRQGTITQEQARQAEQVLDRREQEVQQREEQVERREEIVEERREEAQRLEEFAEEKIDDAQQQREEIARDQQAGIDNPVQAVIVEETGGVMGVTIETTSPTAMGIIVRMNPANANEIRRSNINTIHTRTINIIEGRIFAIAGDTRGQGVVRLVEIDRTSLQVIKQGENDIKTGSLIWPAGNNIYAIRAEGTSYYIARYNLDLEQQASSTIRVHPDASVIVQQGRVITQRENGSILLLNSMDLTEIR